MKTIDIYSQGDYPANALSNFAEHTFTMDGVVCASIEGFLQALKYRDERKQAAICRLAGLEAKKAGAKKRLWKIQKRVWWKGRAYGLFSDNLQALIDRAYHALYNQNPDFRRALSDAGNAAFTHAIGRHDMRKTILTEYHFLRRIEMLRNSGN